MKSIKVLRDLGCFDEKLIEKLCYSVKLHLPEFQKNFVVESNQPYTATIDRTKFDYSLVQHAKDAGASLKEKEQYIEFKHSRLGCIELLTNRGKISTDILIGADGASSCVRRQLQQEYSSLFPKRNFLMGISADIPIKDLLHLNHQHSHLFFGFAKGVDYGWAFPKSETFNIGFGYKLAKENKVNVNNIMASLIKGITDKPYKDVEIRAGLLPIFYCGGPPAVQWGNIILVGDAAGFVDEWTGEGLYYGIKSAVYAYKAIKYYFDTNKKEGALLKYTSLCSRDFYNDLLYSHKFALLLRSRTHRYRYLRVPYIRNLFIPFSRGDYSYRRISIKVFPRAFKYKITEFFRSYFGRKS